MVATLSLFTTGWGIAMLVIAFLVNRTVEGTLFEQRGMDCKLNLSSRQLLHGPRCRDEP